MAAAKKFMVLHQDPGISWERVEETWGKLANIESATWIRTYYNKKEKIRYCLWLAEDEAKLKEIFRRLEITYQSMIEIEETVPDFWGRIRQKHPAGDAESGTK